MQYSRYYYPQCPANPGSFHIHGNYLLMNNNGLELNLKHVFKFSETQTPPVLSRNV